MLLKVQADNLVCVILLVSLLVGIVSYKCVQGQKVKQVRYFCRVSKRLF